MFRGVLMPTALSGHHRPVDSSVDIMRKTFHVIVIFIYILFLQLIALFG